MRPLRTARWLLPALSFAAACAPADPAGGEGAAKGTEIGDEGGEWPCAEVFVPWADPAEAPPGFAVAPDAVALALDGVASGAGATLALVLDLGSVRLADMEPAEVEDPPADWTEPTCEDFLLIGAAVDLVAPGAALQTEAGLVAVGLDGAAALGASASLWTQSADDPDDDEGGDGSDGGGDGGDGGGHATLDADPEGFRYEEMQTVDLVLRGEAVEGGFELELVVQATSLPEGEDGAVRDLEEEVWAGRVVAQ
jgi:hypothetical protein